MQLIRTLIKILAYCSSLTAPLHCYTFTLYQRRVEINRRLDSEVPKVARQARVQHVSHFSPGVQCFTRLHNDGKQRQYILFIIKTCKIAF